MRLSFSILLPFAFSLHGWVAAAPIPMKSTFAFGMPAYTGQTAEDLTQHVADTAKIHNIEKEIRAQVDALHGHVVHAQEHPDQVHPSITQNFGHNPNLPEIQKKLQAIGTANTPISHFRDHTMNGDTLAIHHDTKGIRFHPDFHKLPVEVAASVAIHEISHGHGTKDYHYEGHPLGPDGHPETHKPVGWHAISADEVHKHTPHGMVLEGYKDNNDHHQHLLNHASEHMHLNADSYFGAAHQALHGHQSDPQKLLDEHWKRPKSQPGSPKLSTPPPLSPAKVPSHHSDEWPAWGSGDEGKKHAGGAPHGTSHPPAHKDTHKRG